jgi:hypothetical protein
VHANSFVREPLLGPCRTTHRTLRSAVAKLASPSQEHPRALYRSDLSLRNRYGSNWLICRFIHRLARWRRSKSAAFAAEHRPLDGIWTSSEVLTTLAAFLECLCPDWYTLWRDLVGSLPVSFEIVLFGREGPAIGTGLTKLIPTSPSSPRLDGEQPLRTSFASPDLLTAASAWLHPALAPAAPATSTRHS